MKTCLVILDSFEYKRRELEFLTELNSIANVSFTYSKYENRLIEYFATIPCIGSFCQHIAYWLLSLWYAIKLCEHHNMYDVMVFINPIVGIFFSGLSRALRRKQNITIGGFLFEQKQSHIYFWLRKIIVNVCYKHVNKIFVYGESEINYYESLFPKLSGKFHYVRYGRDFIYSNKQNFQYPRPYISSGGRSNRNYNTLAEALEMLQEKSFNMDCLVATRPECVTSIIKDSPMKILYGITLNQFGSFLEGSSIFVLPLKNITLSAGHMAMLEAMSYGKPIIVTDIPAIRDYVSEKEVFCYDPDNSKDLADCICFVWKNLSSPLVINRQKAAKELYDKEYSFKALLLRIVKISVKNEAVY